MTGGLCQDFGWETAEHALLYVITVSVDGRIKVRAAERGAIRQGHQHEGCSEYLCTFHLDFLAFRTLRTF